jgi:hypothetical protein
VRGVFYRAVAAKVVDKTEQGYGIVDEDLIALRDGRQIPYEWIPDGTRFTVGGEVDPWNWSMRQCLKSAVRNYVLNPWVKWSCRVEFFCEKDAMTAILRPAVEQWQCPLHIVRGFSSLAFVNTIGERLRDSDVPMHFYLLGDWDEQGTDAHANIRSRLEDLEGPERTFKRLAVTPEQIEQYGLTTRPPKVKGKGKNAEVFESGAVDIDAMSSTLLRQLIADAAATHIPWSRFDEMEERAERVRDEARDRLSSWPVEEVVNEMNDDEEDEEDNEDDDA